MLNFTQKQKKTIAAQISIALDRTLPGRGNNQKLATLMGVTPSTISQWKKGAKTPTLLHLFQLSKVLNTPIHILCGFSGKRKVYIGNRIFDHVITLSIIGEILDKSGKTPATAARKLDRIKQALETLERTSSDTE